MRHRSPGHTWSQAWRGEDPDRLRRWQLKQLRRYLTRQLIPFAAFHGERLNASGFHPHDLRAWSDLEALPLMSKEDLTGRSDTKADPKRFVVVPEEAALRRRPEVLLSGLVKGRRRTRERLAHEYRPIFMTSTTGRSADPVPFLYTAHDLDHLAIGGRRMMEICQSDPANRHLNLFPFAPHLAFWLTHYAGIGFDTFCLGSGGGKAMGTEGNVRLIERLRPDALIGMPTFLYHVLSEAVARGLDGSNLRKIVLGGEKVPEGMRRKLRGLCAELGAGKVDVMATYGFTEAKMAWPECPAGAEGGYHLYPDLGLIEIIDPDTGRQVEDGKPGEIVYTPLDSRGSVVLRYRTGDRIDGGLVHEACPGCGCHVPRLVGRISRVHDFRRLEIGKIKGTLVNFNELEHLLDDLDGVGAWQIEIAKRHDDPLECDELRVHVEARASSREASLREEITRRFRESAEVSPNRILFHDAATLRQLHGVGDSLKEEKVVDRRPDATSSPKPSSSAADSPARSVRELPARDLS